MALCCAWLHGPGGTGTIRENDTPGPVEVLKMSKNGLFFTEFEDEKSTSQHLKVPKVVKVVKSRKSQKKISPT